MIFILIYFITKVGGWYDNDFCKSNHKLLKSNNFVFLNVIVREYRYKKEGDICLFTLTGLVLFFFLPSLQMRSIKGCSPLDKILDM